MEKISDSIGQAIKNRVVSTTLATYLFFWAAFHWEGIYTSLFTNEDLIFGKFGLLKNEYVNHYFFSWNGWQTLVSYLAPIVLTILFVWPIPKYILIHAYRQEQRHKVDRRRVRMEEEEKLQIKREQLAVREQKAIEAELDASRAKKEAENEDPSIAWASEYRTFEESGLTEHLAPLSEAIYKGGGRTYAYYDNDARARVGANLSKDTIAIAHANNLITIKEGILSLTDKGKYFISQSYKNM